jgi:UDP-N-acetylmuramate--alanine ligase
MNDHPTALRPGARVHLVGIGGAGMSALAQILLERGHPVSGSDLRGGPACAALAAMGAAVAVGHDAAHVDGADLVVVSSAVPSANPEIGRAARLGIPTIVRAELLELLLAGSRRLLVTGTHGKTTTTSMATVALQSAGLDPSFAIGGTLHDAGTSAHHGRGDVFVAEADEAYRSFLRLTPDCAVVTNVEMDHHDAYADEAAVATAFRRFLARRTPGAPALVCRDDAGGAALLDDAGPPTVAYGEHPDASLRVAGVELAPDGSAFRLSSGVEDLGRFELRLPGRHNVLNAAAAVGAALWAGADIDAVRAGLAGFHGAQRRFQRLGDAGGVTVVDDYGHHPTEIAATIAAARQTLPHGRLVAVFQPHRYSRTAALGAALGTSLAAADLVVVTDVYPAGEAAVPGVTGALVADAAAAAGADTRFVPSTGDVAETVAALAAEGDLVLTLGAGDITEVGRVLLRLLEGRRG